MPQERYCVTFEYGGVTWLAQKNRGAHNPQVFAGNVTGVRMPEPSEIGKFLYTRIGQARELETFVRRESTFTNVQLHTIFG